MYAEVLASRDILCELLVLVLATEFLERGFCGKKASICFRFGSQNWKGFPTIIIKEFNLMNAFRFKTPPNTTERYSIRIFTGTTAC